MVATLGVMTIIQSVLAMIYGSQYKSIPGSNEMLTFTILGARVTLIQLIIFATGILACLGLMALTFWTRFGRAIVALSDSAEMSRIVGIHPDRNIAWVLFIGAGLAGLAGVLISYDVGVEPAMGMELLLKGAVASIIGGLGQLYGVIVGGFVLGTVENFGIWQLPVEWKSAIAFVLLIVFLIFRPQGIFNKK